jgi:hypothetical protein
MYAYNTISIFLNFIFIPAMSYISLSSFSRSRTTSRKASHHNLFRNSRIIHKLRNGMNSQDNEQMMPPSTKPIKTEPDEQLQGKSLLNRVKSSIDDDVKSNKSVKSFISRKSASANEVHSFSQNFPKSHS